LGAWSFADSGLLTIDLSNVSSLGTASFYNQYGDSGRSLQSAILGNKITAIPAFAFAGNYDIEATMNLSKITSIEAQAFAECDNIGFHIVMGDNVTNLACDAFKG
jgi:hypothetical protein